MYCNIISRIKNPAAKTMLGIGLCVLAIVLLFPYNEAVCETTVEVETISRAAKPDGSETYEPLPESEDSLYLSVELTNSSTGKDLVYSVLRWKEFTIRAKLVITAADGSVSAVDVTDDARTTWTLISAEEAVLTQEAGRFFAVREGSCEVRCSFADGNTNKTYSTSATINVHMLRVTSDAEVLRYAALSHLSYTSFSGTDYAFTVEKLLTPVASGGNGKEIVEGKVSIHAAPSRAEVAANIRDLVAACAGDCSLVTQYNDGAFSASVFERGDTIIIAYRGTDDLQDLLYSDAALGLGQIEKDQFVTALSVYRNVRSNAAGKRIVLTGHSLGGGLANYVALLTGETAYTFNAPSTMVTTLSNARVLPTVRQNLVENYRGLNDGKRTDYVNASDWVGKVGVGDSSSQLWTGLGETLASGNLDRTVYKQPAYRNSGFMARFDDHPIWRMVNYDSNSETISLTSTNGSTSPVQYDFMWGDTYFGFGSTKDDTIDVKETTPCSYAYIVAGDGDDTIAIRTRGTRGTIIGGRGNDTIVTSVIDHNSYYIYKGQGEDSIEDHSGTDELYVYGDVDLVCKENNGMITVMDNNVVIAKLNVDGFWGTFSIYENDQLVMCYTRHKKILRVFEVHCPADVEVYDQAGSLVDVIKDGLESSGEGAYGSYRVYWDANGYAKDIIISMEGYSLKIVGVGEGTMTYSSKYEQDKSTEGWRLDEIPVHVGSVFYPAMEYDNAAILRGDIDGDGYFEYNPLYTKTESIILPETLELGYGEHELVVEIIPSDAEPELLWSSNAPAVISVDETGKLSAKSIGTAVITCTATDGSNVSASVTIQVSDRRLWIEDCEFSALSQQYEYTGMPITPDITLTYNGKRLEKDRDYRVAYTNNLMPGTASIIIEGLAPYEGTVTKEFEIGLNVPDTVAKKVESLAAECIASGASSDYEIAVWMHDWLIYNADYDETYTQYSADGVLLKGRGVCQSYALAFSLLMDRMGIDCRVISSLPMDHAWNIVCIDGMWCHVDCTWDDPIGGGLENHFYFGMSDSLISRDHYWTYSKYPSCTSLIYYYPLVNGVRCVSTPEAFADAMSQIALEQKTEYEIIYVGSDSSFDMWSEVEKWYAANDWRYGVYGYYSICDPFRAVITVAYTETWEKPDYHVDPPQPAPDFALMGTDGCYRLSHYENNGVMLIFGSPFDWNTASLLDSIYDDIDKLAAAGVDVLVVVPYVYDPNELMEYMTQYPGMRFVCDSGYLEDRYVAAANYEGSTAADPTVCIINSNSEITYCISDYVTEVDELLSEAFRTGTGNPLPQPEKGDYSQGYISSGSINEIDGEDAELLRELCADSDALLFLIDGYVYDELVSVMDDWERNSELYDHLGLRLVVSVYDGEVRESDYPHIIFLENDSSLEDDMLHAVGIDRIKYSSLASYIIMPDGRITKYSIGNPLTARTMAINLLTDMSYSLCVPAAMTAICEEAFCGTSFETVNLMDSEVNRIDARAFADCATLTLIAIPESVEYIAEDAFSGNDTVMIFCESGSVAHTFAINNGLTYLAK